MNTSTDILQDLINISYKTALLAKVSIDSKQLKDTTTKALKLRLLWDYLDEYVHDDSELDEYTISKLAASYSTLNISGVTASSFMSAASGIAVLIAGEGINGDTYSGMAATTWSLDDLLASPTDSIIIPNSIV